MPQNNVTDFVSHHTRDLRLIIRRFQRAPVDVNESAWQRERINRFVVDDLKLKRILLTARSVRSQLLAQSVDIRGRLPVVQYRQLALRLLRNLSAHFYVLFGRKKIPARL